MRDVGEEEAAGAEATGELEQTRWDAGEARGVFFLETEVTKEKVLILFFCYCSLVQ